MAAHGKIHGSEITGTDSLDEFDPNQQERKSMVNEELLQELQQYNPKEYNDKASTHSTHSTVVHSSASSMRMPSAVQSVDLNGLHAQFDEEVRYYEQAIGSAMHDVIDAGEHLGTHMAPELPPEDVIGRMHRVYSNAEEEEVEVLHRFTVEKHQMVRRITLDRIQQEEASQVDEHVSRLIGDATLEEIEMDNVIAELHALLGEADEVQTREIDEMKYMKEQIESAVQEAESTTTSPRIVSPHQRSFE